MSPALGGRQIATTDLIYHTPRAELCTGMEKQNSHQLLPKVKALAAQIREAEDARQEKQKAYLVDVYSLRDGMEVFLFEP